MPGADPRLFSLFDQVTVTGGGTQEVTLTMGKSGSQRWEIKEVTGFRETKDVTITSVKVNDKLDVDLKRLIQMAVQCGSGGLRIPVGNWGTFDFHGTMVVTAANGDATDRDVAVGLLLKEVRN